MHDRRVAVELDEFCRGTALRANRELAEVWKLKDGVMNYMNYMHKIWPLEPGPQVIYKVLDDSRWASVAGDDKKLRANMIRQFFNEVVEENAGKAVVHAMCLTYPEAKAKWLRLIEREFPHTSGMSTAARGGGGNGAARSGSAANKRQGRAGGQPQGMNDGGTGGQGGGGGNTGGGGGGRPGGSVFSTPIPRFNGMSSAGTTIRPGALGPLTQQPPAKTPSPLAFLRMSATSGIRWRNSTAMEPTAGPSLAGIRPQHGK
jgi:hypothetical protein